MKIAILSNSPNAYSQRRIKEEIRKRGHECNVISPLEVFAYVSSDEQDMAYETIGGTSDPRLSDFDAIIPRIGGEVTFDYGCMIVQHLNENLDIFSTATEFGMRICSNKFKNAQFLSKHGIRVPTQILSHHPHNYGEIIEMAGGLPAVGKLQRGSLGDGVFWMSHDLAAVTSLRSFEKTGNDVIVQKFIDSGFPRNDIRVIVIGGETSSPLLYAYKRLAGETDFRSNYSIHHNGEKVELTQEEEVMAINAARLMGMPFTGIDIMRHVNDDDKPYIIEANSAPGLEGIETITKENIAGALVEYVIDNYQQGGKNQNWYNYFMSKHIGESLIKSKHDLTVQKARNFLSSNFSKR